MQVLGAEPDSGLARTIEGQVIWVRGFFAVLFQLRRKVPP